MPKDVLLIVGENCFHLFICTFPRASESAYVTCNDIVLSDSSSLERKGKQMLPSKKYK